MVFDSIVVVVLGFSRVSNVCCAVDLDGLRCRRDSKIEIQRRRTANFDRDRLRGLLGKARCAHGDGIGSWIDLREEKTAIVVGLHGARGPGVDLSGRDCGIGSAAPVGSEHRS